MLVVESQFRVKNGMEQAVREAFLARPHLVDNVAGFLGLDVYTRDEDPAVFHLVTRWTDRAAYERWHRGDLHRASHAFIPRGLKLDAAFTRVTALRPVELEQSVGEARSDEDPTPADLRTALADTAPRLASWLFDATTTCAMLVGGDGANGVPNAALANRLGHAAPVETVALEDVLAADDAGALSERMVRLRNAGERGVADTFLLNFVNERGSPFTLRCWMDVQERYALLVGEDADGGEDRLRDELLAANNEMARLVREREERRRELEAAHAELARAHQALAKAHAEIESSYWHIRRFQEVLPICMSCGRVHLDDAHWVTVREFLSAHARHPFLSHDYCPPCADAMLAELDDGSLSGSGGG